MKNPIWPHVYFAEEDQDEQKEVAKLLKEDYDGISVKNRKKEDSKDVRLEAASVKEPNIQLQGGKID